VVKHVDAVEMRVVVAAVLAVAANAVLVAKHLPKTVPIWLLRWPASMYKSRAKKQKDWEERRNLRNSVWNIGTGNSKCRWHARVYPERKIK
jgi:hypothetical protein